VYVTIAVVLDFFVKHYIFRWRTAMNDYYMAHWEKVRHIEGAAQRVQEDTMRFASIMEGLGIDFMRSLMVLFAFLPILAGLSGKITELPLLGSIPYSLVWVAIAWALAGTLLLALVGIKLPGLQFQNQRVEAAYRKELVYGEDDPQRASPPVASALFGDVRKNYFRLFFHYLYFDVVKWSYIQAGVMVPYIALGPTVVGGVITLGVMQQIVRAFGRVESAFQFLVLSWSTVVELLSVYKRLRAFEQQIKEGGGSAPAGGEPAATPS
ncbi:MAG TPA: SbmA/BacA-like family transporter, partial [Ramlibacter sp.]|nr:SbmA/BacA-like family transporter [Ramlibacter sp.]